LIPRIWELREYCSAYDAAYIALAEAVVDDSAAAADTAVCVLFAG
jgi:predicted nucleic acid-binding protein